MFENLSPAQKKALVIGAVVVGAVALFVILSKRNSGSSATTSTIAPPTIASGGGSGSGGSDIYVTTPPSSGGSTSPLSSFAQVGAGLYAPAGYDGFSYIANSNFANSLRAQGVAVYYLTPGGQFAEATPGSAGYDSGTPLYYLPGSTGGGTGGGTPGGVPGGGGGISASGGGGIPVRTISHGSTTRVAPRTTSAPSPQPSPSSPAPARGGAGNQAATGASPQLHPLYPGKAAA